MHKVKLFCLSRILTENFAFSVFSKKGYYVKSFGTGDKVKLPGTAIDKPNIYDFNCTYDEIYNDLARKDKALYPFYKQFRFKMATSVGAIIVKIEDLQNFRKKLKIFVKI